MPANAKLKQELIQVTYDKITGVQEPGGDFESVLIREVDRAVEWVENRVRTSLSPARYTNLPKTPEEAYNDRERFSGSIDGAWASYPKWEDLNGAQKALYGNNSALYEPGSLSYDLLTEDQRFQWSAHVSYSNIKIGPEERQDGKASSYIKLYKQPAIEVYGLSLSFVAPPGYEGKNVFFRAYQRNEFYVYNKEGAIHIFPAVMARIMNTTQDPLYGSQYGVVAPRIPQVLAIDYEFGYANCPLELQEAVGLKAAMSLILYVSNLLTAGVKSFGVDGFNAQLGDGLLYAPMYNEYKARLQQVLRPFYQISMTSW